jgi:hypothetical protein
MATSKKTAAKQAPAPADGKKLPTTAGSQRPPSAVRDQSSHTTGQSVFDRADAGNRRLGKRNRT